MLYSNHVQSLAGTTRNKSANFFCLDMGKEATFHIFPFYKVWMTISAKMSIERNRGRFIGDNSQMASVIEIQ